VLVHVDARRAEVSVPTRFRADASLVLRFGYNLQPAIADLEISDAGITGTLTFGGNPHLCVLPWTAVYAAMVEGEQRGTVWPEDVPEDVLTGGPDATGASPTQAPSTAPAAAAAPVPAMAKDDDARAKRGHLKLVD
jgi:stringent starvation protein B